MSNTSPHARSLIEMLLEDTLEDVALDFIEEAVGRYTFPKSWHKLTEVERVAMAEGWLRGKGDAITQPRDLVHFVDKVSADGYVWKR